MGTWQIPALWRVNGSCHGAEGQTDCPRGSCQLSWAVIPGVFSSHFIPVLPLVTAGQTSTAPGAHCCRAEALKACPVLQRGGEGRRAWAVCKGQERAPAGHEVPKAR